MSMYLPGSGGVPEDRKPEIDYPCSWSYTLIGRTEAGIREAVAGIVGARAHQLVEANTSPGGKYLSMRLELVVLDEPDRLLLFERLAAHDGVRFVI
jgi:putative lipoic acid-binding regulatory protein